MRNESVSEFFFLVDSSLIRSSEVMIQRERERERERVQERERESSRERERDQTLLWKKGVPG